jgi:superfamily I DNA and RNA helicase
MSNYIYILKKNLIGETVIKLKAERVPFQLNDIVYVADLNKKIHSRWQTIKRNDKVVTLIKKPENAVSINFEEVLGNKYNKKVNLLTDEEANILEKYFIHKIKILPFYDIEGKNKVESAVLDTLRKNDYDIEVYTNIIKNHTENVNFGDYNVIISSEFGVFVYICVNGNLFESQELFEEFQRELNEEEKIRKLLLNSSMLTEDGMNLKIGYRKYYIVESEKSEEYYAQVNKILESKGFTNIYVLNSLMLAKKIYENINSKNEIVVDKDSHFGVLQMLMPQYINSKNTNINRDKIKFVPQDSYEIDENQKAVLAQMNENVYIKAAAGSGKTILLLAKAYEVAVANQQKDFLIICYNAKLAEDIRIQAENTGKVIENLKIKTLDKFIQEEITQYGDPHNGETFKIRKEIFVENVRSGKYTKKFGGIFLDEMQQLEEKWIEALIGCLDENKYMVLAGDYYQQINKDKNSEEYDDEIIEEFSNEYFYIGECKFKKIILDRNYRNADNIVKIINKMLKQIIFYIDELNIPIENEKKIVVQGKGIRKNTDIPKYFNVYSEEEEIEKIVDCLIDLLKNKGYMQNEILLLSPWGKSSVHLIYMLKKRISELNISICDFEETGLKKDGVRLGTIGRAIGLDFKAVIIYGTNMLQSSKEEKFKFQQLHELKMQNISIKREFIQYLKNIYVGCSRARETLIIINDIKKENLITEFLKIVGENENE